MKLRKLMSKDASYIYEWMQDSDVTKWLHRDYSNVSMPDAYDLIEQCNQASDEVHFSIVTEDDEYMGMVSLRYVDKEAGHGELFIVVREVAMGKGYAWFGMVDILNQAFGFLGLEKVYWNVSRTNTRARRFFDKHGFNMLDEDIPEDIRKRNEREEDCVWYAVLRGDDYQNEALKRGMVAGCKVVRVKTIPTIEAGELSFFESTHDIPFEIKRIYYISKVPEGVRRGYHAHKELKQLLFCPYGKIQLILENKDVREEITLSDPSIGILIEKPTWREMLWMENNSVLVVAASEFYCVDDYIRDYDAFKDYVENHVQ